MNIRGITILMTLQGLMNIVVSEIVIAEGVRPAPTGFWYFCNGPLALLSGTVALIAARRNRRFEDRELGLLALGLIGISGIGTYKMPSGLLIAAVGIYLYLKEETKEAFLHKGYPPSAEGGDR